MAYLTLGLYQNAATKAVIALAVALAEMASQEYDNALIFCVVFTAWLQLHGHSSVVEVVFLGGMVGGVLWAKVL